MTNGLETRTKSRKKTAAAGESAAIVEVKESVSPTEAPPEAVTELVVEAATPAAPVAESTERDDQLLGSIESVLLSVDRPVSAMRLAEALGLIDPESEPIDEEEAEAEAAPAPTKRRGKKGEGEAAKPTPIAIVRKAVATLNSEYEATNRAFRIEAVAGGYRLMTMPHFAEVIENFLGKRERTALSRPAVETLAIIAYKQPITRAQLESVRGVACGEVLRTLVERRLVTITGRAEELGRPMLYGTTRPFLEAFGLSSLKDLPSVEEFRARHVGGDGDAA